MPLYWWKLMLYHRTKNILDPVHTLQTPGSWGDCLQGCAGWDALTAGFGRVEQRAGQCVPLASWGVSEIPHGQRAGQCVPLASRNATWTLSTTADTFSPVYGHQVLSCTFCEGTERTPRTEPDWKWDKCCSFLCLPLWASTLLGRAIVLQANLAS